MGDEVIDVSILVVGYNSLPYLETCLGAIPAACQTHRYEVLFVNNGTDGSEAFLRDAFPDVRVLPSRGNVGFAAGNNYLADQAKGTFVLLLNPDTQLYSCAIDILIDTAREQRDLAVVGGITVSANGQPEPLANMEFPTVQTMLRALAGRASRDLVIDPQADVIPAEAINGGFMMVDRTWWQRLGGMDGSFFLYAEEIDFFKRLKDAGGKVGIVPQSRIFHDIGSGDVNSPTRKFFLATGNAHYLRKHFPPLEAALCIFLYWLVLTGRYVTGRLLGFRGERHRRRARAFAKLALRPWTWVRGYDSPGADPRKAAA